MKKGTFLRIGNSQGRTDSMSDNRKWYQKFFDQCSFGPKYTIQLTPEQTDEALKVVALRRGWRAKYLLEELERGRASMTSIGGQSIVTITVDTSDGIVLRDLLGLTRSNFVSKTEDCGFWSTTTRMGSQKGG